MSINERESTAINIARAAVARRIKVGAQWDPKTLEPPLPASPGTLAHLIARGVDLKGNSAVSPLFELSPNGDIAPIEVVAGDCSIGTVEEVANRTLESVFVRDASNKLVRLETGFVHAVSPEDAKSFFSAFKDVVSGSPIRRYSESRNLTDNLIPPAGGALRQSIGKLFSRKQTNIEPMPAQTLPQQTPSSAPPAESVRPATAASSPEEAPPQITPAPQVATAETLRPIHRETTQRPIAKSDNKSVERAASVLRQLDKKYSEMSTALLGRKFDQSLVESMSNRQLRAIERIGTELNSSGWLRKTTVSKRAQLAIVGLVAFDSDDRILGESQLKQRLEALLAGPSILGECRELNDLCTEAALASESQNSVKASATPVEEKAQGSANGFHFV